VLQCSSDWSTACAQTVCIILERCRYPHLWPDIQQGVLLLLSCSVPEPEEGEAPTPFTAGVCHNEIHTRCNVRVLVLSWAVRVEGCPRTE
jgi:hypothetical protein